MTPLIKTTVCILEVSVVEKKKFYYKQNFLVSEILNYN